MDSFAEFFFSRMSIALWANLRSVFVVNRREVFSTLPADPRQQLPELTETTVKHLFSKKTFCRDPKINIFDKNHIC